MGFYNFSMTGLLITVAISIFANAHTLVLPKQQKNVSSTKVLDTLGEVLRGQENYYHQKLQLVQNVEQLMSDVQTLKNEVVRLKEENENIQTNFTGEIGSLKTQYLGHKTHSAFYAYYSADFKSLPKGQTFVFDTVVTNHGNVYNEKTGTFIAPTSGVFAFSWTLHAAGKHISGESGDYGEMGAVLTQNGIKRGSVVADTETQYNEDAATGFVILNLAAGDEVKIVSNFLGQGSMYSNDHYGRTSFSGFLIHP